MSQKGGGKERLIKWTPSVRTPSEKQWRGGREKGKLGGEKKLESEKDEMRTGKQPLLSNKK